jgi:Fe-S cluster assembly iron-binding protein IscA
VRVGVKNAGCSGKSYNLEYVKEKNKYDEVVQQDGIIYIYSTNSFYCTIANDILSMTIGVMVLVASNALLTIIGSEMDYVEDKLSAGFVFNNPNVKESCGCGQSFMV